VGIHKEGRTIRNPDTYLDKSSIVSETIVVRDHTQSTCPQADRDVLNAEQGIYVFRQCEIEDLGIEIDLPIRFKFTKGHNRRSDMRVGVAYVSIPDVDYNIPFLLGPHEKRRYEFEYMQKPTPTISFARPLLNNLDRRYIENVPVIHLSEKFLDKYDGPLDFRKIAQEWKRYIDGNMTFNTKVILAEIFDNEIVYYKERAWYMEYDLIETARDPYMDFDQKKEKLANYYHKYEEILDDFPELRAIMIHYAAKIGDFDFAISELSGINEACMIKEIIGRQSDDTYASSIKLKSKKARKTLLKELINNNEYDIILAKLDILSVAGSDGDLELFPVSAKEPSDPEDPDLEDIAYAEFERAVREK
jgi:hypothetical protein